MVPKPVASSLRRQFAWLVVALLVVAALQAVAGQIIASRFEHEVTRIGTAQQANQRALQLLTDAETGMRGYQLTGRPEFLDPYDKGIAQYPAQLGTAQAKAGEEARRLLSAEQAAAWTWLAEVAGPIVTAAPADSRTILKESKLGKALFDALRDANTAVDVALEAERKRAVALFRRHSAEEQTVIGLLGLLAVGLAVLAAVRTSKLLLSPLGLLDAALQRLTGGERTARAPLVGPVEVRQLARTLNDSLDATERAEADVRAARDDLVLRNEYFAQMLDALNISVISCDADGMMVYRNRVARHARAGDLPQRADELPGLHDGDPLHPLARALRGEVLENQEMTLHRPGQADRAVLVDARPLTTEDDTVLGAVASGCDITVLRDREAELAAFAGVVAHDLKAPLAMVQGYAELLGLELDGDAPVDRDEMRRLTDRMVASVSRMSSLIDDLLAYATARDKPLNPEMVNLNALLGEIATERGGATPAAAALPAPLIEIDPLPMVVADTVMIRQLFENLIGNAIKYTPPGETPLVHVWAAPDGTDLRLHIDDHGIGIPPDQQAHVFTAFHRAHADRAYTGTGLGLAICERVVTRHHGSITAETNPAGIGTRITVTLPREQHPEANGNPLFAVPEFVTG